MLDKAWLLLEGTFTGIFDAIMWLVPVVLSLPLMLGILFLPAIVFWLVNKIKELPFAVLIFAVILQVVWVFSSFMFMVKF